MKSPKKKRPGFGRPSIEIDFKFLERICEYPLKKRQVAHIMGICDDTLEKKVREKYGITFSDFLAQKGGKRRFTLIETMYEVATQHKNVGMLIYLSKNWLQMSDMPEPDDDSNEDEIIYETEWGKPVAPDPEDVADDLGGDDD